MRHFFAYLWLMLLPVILTGCATADNLDNSPCAALPGGGRYCLQPTTAIEPFEVQQKVDISFKGRRETMIVELEVDAQGMRFVGVTPFGHKLIQADFDNRTVGVAVSPDKRLDPALLLAILQIALWPADRVREGLGDPSQLVEEKDLRRVFVDGRTSVDVGYTGGRLPRGNAHIVFPLADIELDVSNLDDESTGTSTETSTK